MPPTFQKFDRADFVEGFLRAPQRSLKFQPVDRVSTIRLDAVSHVASGAFAGSAREFLVSGGTGVRPVVDPPAVRAPLKLFLPTHQRYYVVVCELRCDVPGLPPALGETPCQAGFVVRRRALHIPATALAKGHELLRTVVAAQDDVAYLDQTSSLKGFAARQRAKRVAELVRRGTFAQEREAKVLTLERRIADLQAWGRSDGEPIRQGWFQAVTEPAGAWKFVEDQPALLEERWYPLHRLHENRDLPRHDAAGHALYFGRVPLTSLDTNAFGHPRFDDESTYEIRCFVRRHREGCPRTLETPDCAGELVWSEPTEPYRIASPLDLEGTSNRPVTIKMPDLNELMAQALKGPPGKFSPARFVQPQTLPPHGGPIGAKAVCFFSIPLITIVALFVLNLFLPIVVALFGLWPLLALRFCFKANPLPVPPSITSALSDMNPAQFDSGFGFDVNNNPVDVVARRGALINGLASHLADTTGVTATEARASIRNYAPSLLMRMGREAVRVKGLPQADDPTRGGIDLASGAEYEDLVPEPMVLA